MMRPAVSNVSNTCRDKERCEVMTGNPHARGDAGRSTWVGVDGCLDAGDCQKMRPDAKSSKIIIASAPKCVWQQFPGFHLLTCYQAPAQIKKNVGERCARQRGFLARQARSMVLTIPMPRR